MSSNDLDYYLRRARDERQRASECDQANVAEIHEELARLYEALVEHAELRPAPWPVSVWSAQASA
jgi:hypothetical protein